MAGAKWTLGFVLHMNHAQFSQGLNKAVQGVRLLRQQNGISHRGAMERERNIRAAYGDTRSAVVRSAAAAAGLFTTLAVGRRIITSLTKASNEFHYESEALAATLGLQHGAGEKLYQQFVKLNPHIREFAPKEVVGRMKQLAQAGYNQNEILTSMGAILDTVSASFGELSVAQGVEMGINLHRAFGDAHTDMRQLLDIAVSAANKFPMTTGQIASAMGYATEAAVQYNQSLEDVLTTVGLLMPVTKTATKAGTVYRNALISLAKPKTIDFLNKYGIAVKDSNGEMRSTLDIYGDMYGVLDKIEKKDKTRLKMEREKMERELGGTRGGAMFAAYDRLYNNASGAAGTPWEGKGFADRSTAVLALKLGVMDSANAAKRMAAQIRETSEVIDRRFQASVSRAAIALGDVFAPVVDRFRILWGKTLDDMASVIDGPSKGDPSVFRGAGTNLAYLGINVTTIVAGVMGVMMGTGIIGRMLGASRGHIWRQVSSMNHPGTGRGIRNLTSNPYQHGTQYQYERRLTMSQTLFGRDQFGQRFQSFGTSLMQVTGLLVQLGTTAYSLYQIWKQTAQELYDFGQSTADKQRARQEKFINAEQAAWKFVSDKAEFKDIVRMKQGGYSPQTAFLLKRYQEGANPTQMYDEMIAAERARQKKQLDMEFATDDVKKTRMEEFDKAAQAHRVVVEQHTADFISKQYEKAVKDKDRVKADQIMAMYGGALADPRRGDPGGYSRQYANLGTSDKPTAVGIASNLADAMTAASNASLRDAANGRYFQKFVLGSDTSEAYSRLGKARLDARMFSMSSDVSYDQLAQMVYDYRSGKNSPSQDPYMRPGYTDGMPSDAQLLSNPAALPQMIAALKSAQELAERDGAERLRLAREQNQLLLQLVGNTADGSGGMSVDPGGR